MPIFQADLEHLEREAASTNSPARPSPFTSAADLQSPSSPSQLYHVQRNGLLRKLSEESIRTELCDGPIPDSPEPATTPDMDRETATSDRAELIERLKRGESPTWIPNRHLGSLFNNLPRSPNASPGSPQPPSESSVNLLPPADITPEKKRDMAWKPQGEGREEEDDQRLKDGLEIQRPSSALHSGDFTQHEQRRDRRRPDHDPVSDRGQHERSQIPKHHAWIATSPPRNYSPFHLDPNASFPSYTESTPSSLSSSFSSTFVYKPPTSPLVQSEINEDGRLRPSNSMASVTGISARRHSLASCHHSPFPPPPRPAPVGGLFSHRREASLPYQAHQPRRSLPHSQSFGGTPQTPSFLRSRRPSFSTDTSPLQHASMVGSYEESILRGRMSTTPSKPLDFVAQIGVLGLGKCKSNLKCPPHVTLPFPAVFYSYAGSLPSQGRALIEDGPSPYVGQIDLENGLPTRGDDHRSSRKMHTRYGDSKGGHGFQAVEEGTGPSSYRDIRRARRRSGSPRTPPGGSYRIPEKGQIQIIIKNPNKTAVKLFLVPYDLTGMEPGTKTFIRQRSYSAGPIIENVPTASDSAAERPILRYLAHLHICCPSRGRFYLYKSIRVVFANRVPDGKEKLHNETTWPDPKFTPYKPIRVMHPPISNTGGPGAALTADKAFRRRSAGFPFGPATQTLDAMDGISQTLQGPVAQHSSPSPFNFGGSTQLVDPIPLRLPARKRLDSDMSDSTATEATSLLRSPKSPIAMGSRPTTKDGLDGQIGRYEKLNKGDVGYGGNAFVSPGQGSPGAAEGLLSQRLRSLGVKNRGESPSEM